MNNVLLTIVTCGKNDDFAGNFVQRLEHNLNKLVDNIDTLDIKDVEILVTDWGSNEDKKLYDVCNVENRDYLKFLHVPYDICKKYSPDSEFSVPHAINSGIRRANGNFVLYIDGDSYIPTESFKKMYELLKSHNPEDNVYYWASRFMIPYKYQSNAKNIQDMDILLKKWIDDGKITSGVTEIADHFFLSKANLSNFMGGAMGLLVSKRIAFETTFLFEQLTKWGWMDVEFFQRMSYRYRCMGDLLELLDCEFYHIGHHEVKVGHDVHGFNPYLRPTNFKANPDNWGLADEKLRINNE